MITSRELLTAVRTAQGIESNYRLARFLDVPEKTVQRWNTGKNTPEDPMVVRLCELASLDPAEVLPAMYAQRAAEGPMAAVWERIAARTQASVATAAGVVLSLFVGGGPDAGAMAATPALQALQGMVCILC